MITSRQLDTAKNTYLYKGLGALLEYVGEILKSRGLDPVENRRLRNAMVMKARREALEDQGEYLS